MLILDLVNGMIVHVEALYRPDIKKAVDQAIR
jgi:hypothetical protein